MQILEGFSELFPLTLSNLPQQQHVMSYQKKIKAVTSCSTHKIDQQETDG